LDGDSAYRDLRRLLTFADSDQISYKDGGTYGNLMNAMPFQIEGNMGAAAGIAEMLLQSHAGDIHLLPALPKIWTTGSVKGLKARKGFVVDITWKDGRLTTASIHSTLGAISRVRTSTEVTHVSSANGQISWTRPEPNVLEFKTRPGETFTLRT
jgi:alpha-L-fucosidase 2